jgi:hypothetical protein
MNTQELIREVQTRHQVTLRPDDPIFAILTMNELLLVNHLEQFKAHLDTETAQVDELMVKRINDSLELHNRQLNETLESLAGLGPSVAAQVTKAGNECVQKVLEATDAGTKNIEKASRVLEPYWCFALLAVGLLFGVLAQKFIFHL